MENKYNFDNIEIYTKGDLAGYMQGTINFEYNNDIYNHEFLYRFNDNQNGENFKLVSVDYGYTIPYINEVWQQLENYLKEYVVNKLYKCVFGYCNGNNDNSFNCEHCGNSNKNQGYTGCVYATRKLENII